MLKCYVISNQTGEKLGEFTCKEMELHTLEKIFIQFNSRVEVI